MAVVAAASFENQRRLPLRACALLLHTASPCHPLWRRQADAWPWLRRESAPPSPNPKATNRLKHSRIAHAHPTKANCGSACKPCISSHCPSVPEGTSLPGSRSVALARSPCQMPDYLKRLGDRAPTLTASCYSREGHFPSTCCHGYQGTCPPAMAVARSLP